MITDFRINAKGELEGKAIPPAKWEEMYTKEEVIAILTDIRDEITSNYLIDVDTGKIISGILHNFKAQKLLDRINNEIDNLKESKE